MPDAPSWKVTSQRQSFATIDGRAMPVMVVGFTTSSGVEGTVQVPLPDYNAEHVAALINEQAQTIQAVHELQGP